MRKSAAMPPPAAMASRSTSRPPPRRRRWAAQAVERERRQRPAVGRAVQLERVPLPLVRGRERRLERGRRGRAHGERQARRVLARGEALGGRGGGGGRRARTDDGGTEGGGRQRGERCGPHLALGHQPGAIRVLQKHPIRQTKQGQAFRQLRRVSHQHHQVQRIEIGGKGIFRRQALHALGAMAEALTQPEAIGLLEPRGPEAPAHRFGPTAAGIGEHR